MKKNKLPYAELMSGFWEENKKFPFGASAVAIYAYLVQQGLENRFQDFTLSDVRLSREIKLGINTVRSVKIALQQRGLIRYTVRPGAACLYHILTASKHEALPLSKNAVEKKKTALRSPGSKKLRTSQPLKGAKASQEAKAASSTKAFTADIPSIDEFMGFARSLKNYVPKAGPMIEKKYADWVKNGWNNDYNRPIIHWKALLKNSLQHIMDADENKDPVMKLPTIKRHASKKTE